MIVIGKLTEVGKVALSTPTGWPTVTVAPFGPFTTRRSAAETVLSRTGWLKLTVMNWGADARVWPAPGEIEGDLEAAGPPEIAPTALTSPKPPWGLPDPLGTCR